MNKNTLFEEENIKEEDIQDIFIPFKIYEPSVEEEWCYKIESLGEEFISGFYAPKKPKKDDIEVFTKLSDIFKFHIAFVMTQDYILPCHIIALIEIALCLNNERFDSFGYNMLNFPHSPYIRNVAMNKIPMYLASLHFITNEGSEIDYLDLLFIDEHKKDEIISLILQTIEDTIIDHLAFKYILLKQSIAQVEWCPDYDYSLYSHFNIHPIKTFEKETIIFNKKENSNE